MVLYPTVTSAAWVRGQGSIGGGGNTVYIRATNGDVIQSAPATVAIYEVLGRLIRTVVDGDYAPGVHTARWDGRDTNGVAIPSGVYFLKSTSVGLEQTRKILVVR